MAPDTLEKQKDGRSLGRDTYSSTLLQYGHSCNPILRTGRAPTKFRSVAIRCLRIADTS
jgi:hypothetical protein